MNNDVWTVQRELQSVFSIFRFLMLEFVDIFGEETMNNEECFIYNDPDADCPMLVTNSAPLKIRLAQPCLDYWAQTIFQLSHELCHYAIRQAKVNKDFTLSWFEEIICEAMSLYSLWWSSKNWDKCEMYLVNKCFGESIRDYLYNELRDNGTGGFQKCKCIGELKQYNAQANRESHRNERNQLFHEIVRDPHQCRCFCDYQQYVNHNRITINFTDWKKNDNNSMVQFLQTLQPCS